MTRGKHVPTSSLCTQVLLNLPHHPCLNDALLPWHATASNMSGLDLSVSLRLRYNGTPQVLVCGSYWALPLTLFLQLNSYRLQARYASDSAALFGHVQQTNPNLTKLSLTCHTSFTCRRQGNGAWCHRLPPGSPTLHPNAQSQGHPTWRRPRTGSGRAPCGLITTSSRPTTKPQN